MAAMKLSSTRDPYVVRSVVHVLTIINAFRATDDVLPLRAVAERTGLGKPTCYRLLYTLCLCGFAEKIDRTGYRLLLGKQSHR
jgi:DNA-binding IclR family transcriptional regulator